MVLLLWAGSALAVFAQTDSLEYLDKDRVRVKSKEEATYYKISHWNGAPDGSGTEITYYLTGEKESVVPFAVMGAVREGVAMDWYKSGQVSEKKYYHQNRLQGISEEWYADGTRKALMTYWQDTLHGTLKTFYPTGALKRKDVYQKGRLKEGHCYAPDSTELPYVPYQTLAEFPKGGTAGLRKFILNRGRMPEAAILAGVGGKVVVNFVVGPDGKVERVWIKEASFREFAQEVMRVMRTMPNWKPGTLEGEPVSQRFVLPIRFSFTQ